MKIENLTPKNLLCIGGVGCPAVFKTSEGKLLIVGRRVDPNNNVNALIPMSPDEELIEIDPELLANVIK